MHANKQEGSAEQFLLKECGIEESKIDGIIRAAVAWRVTPGGRQLIDRRRRSRIERNILICAEYLVNECGIEPGACFSLRAFWCAVCHAVQLLMLWKGQRRHLLTISQSESGFQRVPSSSTLAD